MTRKRAERIPEYLQHILDAIDRATGYVTGMDLKTFEGDPRTQDAVLHGIQIVGEPRTRFARPIRNSRLSTPTFPGT